MLNKIQKYFGLDKYHLVSSIIFALLIFAFSSSEIINFKPFTSLENKIIDLNFNRRGMIKNPDSLDVIIIGISNETLNELPPPYNTWPLPRNLFARAIENLNKAGAKVIGIDLLFNEFDKYSKKNDSALVSVIKKYKNVILAGKIEQFDWRYEAEESPRQNFGNVYLKSDSSIGIVNVLPDDDGVLRRYFPYYFDARTKTKIPTFSLAVINRYYNLDMFFTPQKIEKSFDYGFFKIPEFTSNSFLINFYGPSGTFKTINFIDIIDDSKFQTLTELETGVDINTFNDSLTGLLYSDIFRNKVVLIGSIEPEDKDLFPVSIAPKESKSISGNLMFGVEVHANVVQMILDKNFLHRGSLTVRFAIIFVLIFLCMNLFEFIRSIKFKTSLIGELINFLILILFIVGIYEIYYYLFLKLHLIRMFIPPALAVVSAYTVSSVSNYLKERKQKLIIKAMFSQYLNPKLVDELVVHPEKLKLGGIRKEMSVLFSDLANFTTISEKIDPETLVELLNHYFDEMTEIIFETNGTLDKFEGDAIMAFWNAPLDDPEHHFNSALCALKMKKKVNELKLDWKAIIGQEFSIRIGINSGEMIVGNMGGKKKFDYTVMGDNVNLASRLEGINKIYGTDIVISESIYNKIKDRVIARELDLILVKGKTIPVRIFELIDLKEGLIFSNDDQKEILKLIEYFETGLNLYREKMFSRAIEEFEKVLLVNPDDYPTRVFIDRCFEFLNSPPPDDWNGVFESKIK
ncbi:MAG: adenylate/guanylate cyclase domain-containing protein [Ignavibacteria bacterium]|jgi:adenylate cyclase|nr:adenylate/guanylate cyclase domain-containing protein [Ignavibacteria bacterium]MDH7527679.1 adenylate/guanylate cyclase domain-containing protein [Ignavibacteria bacterium]